MGQLATIHGHREAGLAGRLERPPQHLGQQSPFSTQDDFAALLGHELRTPLSVVLTAAATALHQVSEVDLAEVTRLLEIVERNGRLALLLLKRLDLARELEHGVIRVSPEPLDFADLVRETVQDVRLLLTSSQINLVTDGALEATVDPLALREVIVNLLTNAARYNPPDDPIEISVRAHGDDCVVLTVRDHGPGIRPGAEELLFEKYVQLDVEATGLGLGLFVARGVARAHGGEIRVEAADGGGSSFVVTLPRGQGAWTNECPAPPLAETRLVP